MRLFNKLFNKKTIVRTKMITENGNGFYAWNGKLYKSDIVRACIRPKVKAVGKLVAKHIRETVLQDGTIDIKVNPDVYMRFLLEEPNPYMTGQMLQEKVATQLQLNNNAFIYINHDENGYPNELYPVLADLVEALYDKQGILYLKFTMKNGNTLTFPYKDVIHIRQDYNENDIFGESPQQALTSLMEIVNTTDQGIVKAIKNSMVIKWLMKFKSVLRPEDRDKEVDNFVDNFLSVDKGKGVAATDPKYDLEQIKNESYVPNAAQMDRTVIRIYSFFNTNEKIIQSKYNEDEWNAYYESEIEPVAMQLSGEYTRKLFSRRERGFGNSIVFEASNLQYASMSTKLDLVQMVDRGAMTPNEWRKILGSLAPIEGGDKPIRRLDTAVVEGGVNNG
ncbi:phage portal protein [Clostridium botulinum]